MRSNQSKPVAELDSYEVKDAIRELHLFYDASGLFQEFIPFDEFIERYRDERDKAIYVRYKEQRKFEEECRAKEIERQKRQQAAKEEREKNPFIAFDWCGWNDQYGRFTHVPSCETIVQQKWMGQSDWDKAQVDFFKKFPGVRVYKCESGPYRPEGETYGTTDEIVAKLEQRLMPSPRYRVS